MREDNACICFSTLPPSKLSSITARPARKPLGEDVAIDIVFQKTGGTGKDVRSEKKHTLAAPPSTKDSFVDHLLPDVFEFALEFGEEPLGPLNGKVISSRVAQVVRAQGPLALANAGHDVADQRH